MKRTTEFVLGLIGGILGFIGSIFALFIGGVDAALSDSGSSSIIGLGWLAFVFSILAIVGSVVVKSKPKVGGLFLIISAVGGLISVSMAYLVPAVLLLIAGIMGVARKEKRQKDLAA